MYSDKIELKTIYLQKNAVNRSNICRIADITLQNYSKYRIFVRTPSDQCYLTIDKLVGNDSLGLECWQCVSRNTYDNDYDLENKTLFNIYSLLLHELLCITNGFLNREFNYPVGIKLKPLSYPIDVTYDILDLISFSWRIICVGKNSFSIEEAGNDLMGNEQWIAVSYDMLNQRHTNIHDHCIMMLKKIWNNKNA